MARKKKPTIIPEVDIVKAGIDSTKVSKGDKTDDNRLIVTRSSKGKNIQKRVIVSIYQKQQDKLDKLKKQMDDMNLDKSDIKDIKDDIKKKDKKKKKKDKKKEKKESKDSYMNALVDAVPSDLASYIMSGGEKGIKKKKKKDKKKEKERKSMKGLTVKEKKSSKKKKDKEKEEKNKSEVAERFKEVEKITRENIKEIDSTMAMVDDRIKEITKSSDRMRGKDKALADYIAAKTSLISSRQKAATDILSNRAKIYDIEMKKEKDASSASASDSDIIARIFPGIAMGGANDTNIKDYISKNGKNKDGKKKKNKKIKKGGGFRYDDDDDELSKREKALIKSGDIEYSDYDKNIEWEGQFDVAIKKSWTDGDWKFVAVDDDENIINIPKSMLPSKKTVSMKFDDEKDVAIDINSNRAFRVYQVPTL